MRELPRGTVTFLFTDVEGSTRLLNELGDRYAEVLAEHRRALRGAFMRHGGVEVDTQGDAFFVAFARASDALSAAAEGRTALEAGPVRVRIALHTGEPLVTEEGYVGMDVHRAARIAAAGHGGQILVSQSTRDLVGVDGLLDLGEHRLKDLAVPERIYQLGDGDFPLLKSLNQTNLPPQSTLLIGRQRELADLLDLLHSSRLLTLTGAGGSGKTRLALQTAAEVVDDFADGVWFISLSAVTDPELLHPTIASTLGARDHLIESLRPKRLLLLLDNVEQLLPAVSSSVADLLSAPNVTVLATSRERLSLTSEQEYAVPTLPLEGAVALFTARVRQLKPTFEPDVHVTEIARRLDGLPLALELAAARVKVLTPEQIAERLGHSLDLLTAGARDLPERQRTLRATIEWSHDLLNEEEQSLFVRLAVFAGGFDLESAERVCEADLNVLQSLVDKSLLRQTEEGRFFMLETIREYAAELFERKEEADALRGRHGEFFLHLAEHAAVHIDDAGPEQARWLAHLDREIGNVRAALRFLEVASQWEQLLRLATAFWRVWLVHGHATEGRAWLEKGLRAAPGEFAVRLKAFEVASHLSYAQSDFRRAMELIEEWLAAGRAVDDPVAQGKALHNLANVVGEQDMERGRALDEESLALLGEDLHARYPAFGVAYATLMAGDADAARMLFEKALTLARRAFDAFSIADSLAGLGFTALEREEDTVAAAFFSECAEVAMTLDDDALIARRPLIGLASLLASRGRSIDSARALGCAEAVLETRGEQLGRLAERARDRALEMLRADIGDATLAAAREEGRRLSHGHVDDLVRDIVRSLD
jgi:predicted ATPase